MLLSVLLQAAAAGVGLSKLGAALGAGLAVIGRSEERRRERVYSNV